MFLRSLSGTIVFSSATLNVVDHPEKGITEFGSCPSELVGVMSQMHPGES